MSQQSQPMTDESLMPYGKFKGKALKDVPDYYLMFIWENHDLKGPLYDYISTNLNAIKENIENSKQIKPKK